MRLQKLLWRAIAFIRYLLNSLWLHWIVLPYGIIYCYFHYRDNKRSYFVICNHIGDALYTFGYLCSYRQQKDCARITVVSTKSILSMAEMYSDDIDDTIQISNHILKAITKGQGTFLGKLLYKHLCNIIIIEPANYFNRTFDFISNLPNVKFIDCIRYGILQLEEDSPYHMPKSKCDIIKQNKTFDKYVVLVPDAQVVDAIDYSYFDAIASYLMDMGIAVYTNIASHEDRLVRGTKPFLCDLGTVFQKSKQEIVCFIGVRCGLLDLAYHANCNVIALYPPGYKYNSFFEMDLHIQGVKCPVEIYLTDQQSENLEEIKREIRSIVENL